MPFSPLEGTATNIVSILDHFSSIMAFITVGTYPLSSLCPLGFLLRVEPPSRPQPSQIFLQLSGASRRLPQDTKAAPGSKEQELQMLQYPLNDSITTVKYSQHSDVFPEFASRRHNQYLFANRRACKVHGDKGSLSH